MAAAVELGTVAGPPEGTALATAEAILEHRPADEDIAARLAAALVRAAVSRRTGDSASEAGAAARAQQLLQGVPRSLLDRHPGVSLEVLSARGRAELRAGDFGRAAAILGAATEATAAGPAVSGSAASGISRSRRRCAGT